MASPPRTPRRLQKRRPTPIQPPNTPQNELSERASPSKATLRDGISPDFAVVSQEDGSESLPDTPFTSPTAHLSVQRESQIDKFKFEVRLLYLRQQQLQNRWADEESGEGVLLKTGKGNYISQPRELADACGGFSEQMRKLNVKVAMTVKTPVIETFLATYKPQYVPYTQGQRISIIDSIDQVCQAHRHHYAVFVRGAGLLAVWDEDAVEITDRATRIEKHLVDLVWAMSSEQESDIHTKESFEQPAREESKAPVVATPQPLPAISEKDAETGAPEAPRQTLLWQALVVGCAGCLTIFCLSIGWRALAVEIKYDHSWTRILLVIVSPLQLWLGWFFFMTVCTTIAQLVGPVKQVFQNSKFYSAVPTKRLRDNLPHVTIQCPVYKEGLDTVIIPTVVSVNKAISTYELQGGSASIFVNDDGMQLIPEEEARRRVQFYEDNNIGWVARPKHAPNGDSNGQNVFVRAGKFKKASNMNYCLSVSSRVEDKMAEVERTPNWTQEDEDQLYSSAFEAIIKEDQGRTWGAGNIRMGDFILIIDSDTRVPEDCLLDAVSEMTATPEVAIIQFMSGVLNVTTSFFERAITFFTNLVYTSIRFAVACGDVAPFVGHNAMLRWSALQDVAYVDTDGTEKYWAENTVSEDFDMALRLQSLGYVIRYSTYCGDGFKEGVSLTVYDELIRWEKYAYGCAELLFHPFYKWPLHGPVTPLFRRFITSPISWMGKLTMMSYIGTYFAIGSAWALTLLNYFLLGWFNGHLDKDYAESFNVYFGLVIVFQGAGTVSLAVLRYRVEGRSLFKCLLENMTWMLVLTVFLGGISLHVSGALLFYLFGIDMSWGATAKEATDTSFFREIPVIIKKFKFTFVYCILSVAMMMVLAGIGPLGKLVPEFWRINSFIAIYPQAIMIAMHFFLPLALNPGLMQFAF
ncbi:uncharacterized protein PV06_09197 [Exophiala oligosperma]|uniref:Uncharacterized protein n=2 Tax=Chaetothyriales TaxID=34395 RepID=A0A0D2BPF3_9EURO|nr:uncharacterized protein PV06_09197 [Exophiala oligosperma]KAJ9639144.1 hypothetical protein H2204_004052 [Knufia peltigerae]KIW39427.1 hypothetical protein PV06_09197 [Exophiala oligosperma]